jgi:hypothetical protein
MSNITVKTVSEEPGEKGVAQVLIYLDGVLYKTVTCHIGRDIDQHNKRNHQYVVVKMDDVPVDKNKK